MEGCESVSKITSSMFVVLLLLLSTLDYWGDIHTIITNYIISTITRTLLRLSGLIGGC
jgi:hypothetical protein